MATRSKLNGRVTKNSRKRRPSDIKPDDFSSYIDLGEHNSTNASGQKSPASKSKPPKNKLRGIVINGETYTCSACKSGHRVGVCKHYDRPMIKTKPPGRPPAGQSKRTVCKCPTNCRCSEPPGKCRCARQCVCVQSGWLIVYIRAPDEPANAAPVPDHQGQVRGEFRLDRPVPIDAKGKQLSEEEALRRQQQQEALNNDQHLDQRTRSGSSTSTRSVPSPSQARPEASGGGCCHNRAVAQENRQAARPESVGQFPLVTNQPSAKPPASALFHGCNCGAACSCAFCPQHPNNHVSQNLARQHANMFMNHHHQLFNANLGFMQLPPDVVQDPSCIGGIPTVAFSQDPQMAHPAHLQRHFGGSGGTVIAYEVASYPSVPVPRAPTFDQVLTQDMAQTFGMPSSLNNENPWGFHIGAATVTSNAQGGWLPTESGVQSFPNLDNFGFPPGDAPLGSFDGMPPNPPNMDMTAMSNEPFLPLSTPPHLDAFNQELSTCATSDSTGAPQKKSSSGRAKVDSFKIAPSSGVCVDPDQLKMIDQMIMDGTSNEEISFHDMMFTTDLQEAFSPPLGDPTIQEHTKG